MSLPTAPRTAQAAIDHALSRVGGTMPDGSGYCLKFTRQCYEVPSVYASAIDAWNAATERYEGDWNPPPSASVWFWTPSIYRHVAFHVGAGQVVSTFNAEIRSFPSLDEVERVFGGPYMGWAPELNEHSLRPPVTPPQPPPPEEDEMPWFFRSEHGAIVIVTPVGVRTVDAGMWKIYGDLGWAHFPPGMEAMQQSVFDAIIANLGGLVVP